MHALTYVWTVCVNLTHSRICFSLACFLTELSINLKLLSSLEMVGRNRDITDCILVMYEKWFSQHKIGLLEKRVPWAICLVMSCGSNSFSFYMVSLLCIWPFASFSVTCKCVVQLLVSSLNKWLVFPFLFNKNTWNMYHNQLPHGISETWDICIFPYFIKCLLSYCPNKIAAMFTSDFRCLLFSNTSGCTLW